MMTKLIYSVWGSLIRTLTIYSIDKETMLTINNDIDSRSRHHEMNIQEEVVSIMAVKWTWALTFSVTIDNLIKLE